MANEHQPRTAEDMEKSLQAFHTGSLRDIVEAIRHHADLADMHDEKDRGALHLILLNDNVRRSARAMEQVVAALVSVGCDPFEKNCNEETPRAMAENLCQIAELSDAEYGALRVGILRLMEFEQALLRLNQPQSEEQKTTRQVALQVLEEHIGSQENPWTDRIMRARQEHLAENQKQ